MRILFCWAVATFYPVCLVSSVSWRLARRRRAPGPGARLQLVVSDFFPPQVGLALRGSPPLRCRPRGVLLDDFGDHPGADGAAALADREAQAGIHGDGLDQLDLHLDVVAWHHHLGALRQLGDAGHVRGAEVELRPVAVEERRVAPALLLLEDVDLGLELGVRRDRARLAEHLPALYLLALDAAQEAADVVARATLVEDLAEHLDAGDDRARGLRVDAHDLDGVAGVDDALLDAARGHRAAAGDREDVLDRHQERLVEVALGLRDVGVEVLGELDDLALVLLVALERLQRRAGDERDVVARELVLGQQVADLDLDELEELLVVDHVGLVEEHDDVRHADLPGEQDVLARLRHRAVGGGDHEDRAVHLRGAGDHVLHVVGVAGTVDVGVVPLVGLILHVRRRDRDAARLLLRRVVDLVEGLGLAAVRVGEHLRDRRGQGRLAMVDVTDGADVDVRLVALELLLRHFGLLLFVSLSSLLRYVRRRPARKANPCRLAQLRGDGLPRPALDDLLGDVGRHFLVAVELHRVRRAPLRHRTQVADVAEHLAQRGVAAHHLRVAAVLHPLDAAAAAVEVADDIAHELLGHGDLDGEHRLEQHGLGAARRLLERERARNLEGDLRRVGVVVLAVGQRDAHVDHRVAGAHAGLQRLLDALLDGGDVLGRDRAALDLVDEVEALARRRLDVDVDDAVLARATRLLDEASLDLVRAAAHGLAVGDLRPADVGVDLVLAQHAVDKHLEVQLAHARDLGLAGLLVGRDLERRILLGQAAQRDRHLLLVDLRLRLDRDLDDRLGEVHRLELDRPVRRGERVAGRDLLDAHAGGDVARVDLLDVLAVVRVHHQHAADALGAARRHVEHA